MPPRTTPYPAATPGACGQVHNGASLALRPQGMMLAQALAAERTEQKGPRMVRAVSPTGVPYVGVGFDVQYILHGISNLPEDRYVTTWHFISSDAGAGIVWADTFQAVALRVHEFMQACQGLLSTLAIGTGFKPTSVYGYNPDVAKPRPRHVKTTPSEVNGGSMLSGLPNEVAACVSFHDANVAGQRGRIYFGPLSSSVLNATIPGDAQLAAASRLTLGNAAAALRDKNTNAARWAVKSVSRKDGSITRDNPVYRTIKSGWVDNAFDTQRRRGVKATERHVFPAPPAA